MISGACIVTPPGQPGDGGRCGHRRALRRRTNLPDDVETVERIGLRPVDSFTTLTAVAAPLQWSDINTDDIFPSPAASPILRQRRNR